MDKKIKNGSYFTCKYQSFLVKGRIAIRYNQVYLCSNFKPMGSSAIDPLDFRYSYQKDDYIKSFKIISREEYRKTKACYTHRTLRAFGWSVSFTPKYMLFGCGTVKLTLKQSKKMIERIKKYGITFLHKSYGKPFIVYFESRDFEKEAIKNAEKAIEVYEKYLSE